MILADKIILLRKKCGWSQEELAEQLDISRQSVSKWESGTSVPDLDRIIRMSEIFGVSTDYLLKDELEEIKYAASEGEGKRDEAGVRSISPEEANEFMDLMWKSAKNIAIAVVLFILSPICMLLLTGCSELENSPLTEEAAAGIGMAVLLVIVTVGVVICILTGLQLEKYKFLEKEPISLQYGVQGIVEKKKTAYDKTRRSCIAMGTALCIAGAIPLMIGAALDLSDMYLFGLFALLLVFVAGAVYLFVWAGMIYGSYEKLLQEGDYTKEKKAIKKKFEYWTVAYWCIVTAIYLCISFPKQRWGYPTSWLVWPVAGVIYAALYGIFGAVMKSKENKR